MTTAFIVFLLLMNVCMYSIVRRACRARQNLSDLMLAVVLVDDTRDMARTWVKKWVDDNPGSSPEQLAARSNASLEALADGVAAPRNGGPISRHAPTLFDGIRRGMLDRSR